MELVKLSDISKIQKGYSFKSSKYKTEGLKIIRGGNIQEYEMNTKNMAFFDVLDYGNDLDSYRINKGDILIPLQGVRSLRVIRFPIDSVEYYMGPTICRIKPTKGIDNDFLYYSIRYNKNTIENLITGTMIKGIRQSNLESIRIAIPSIQIQKQKAKELKVLESVFIESNKLIRSPQIFSYLLNSLLFDFYR